MEQKRQSVTATNIVLGVLSTGKAINLPHKVLGSLSGISRNPPFNIGLNYEIID
jgi:hypothetical protein